LYFSFDAQPPISNIEQFIIWSLQSYLGLISLDAFGKASLIFQAAKAYLRDPLSFIGKSLHSYLICPLVLIKYTPKEEQGLKVFFFSCHVNNTYKINSNFKNCFLIGRHSNLDSFLQTGIRRKETFKLCLSLFLLKQMQHQRYDFTQPKEERSLKGILFTMSSA
jgi:hypothetical protein